MSVRIESSYLGDLRFESVHGPSKVKLVTDAPVDNHGKGESFSPTDLVATALVNCMGTLMGIKAKGMGLDLRGMTFSVEKVMSEDAPRRIVALPITVSVPVATTEEQRRSLMAAADTCPVAKSIRADIERPVIWNWK